MAKTVYIDNKMCNILKESILMDTLPEDIINIVYKNKTSLGNNPALPNVFENGFLEKIVKKRFIDTKEELKKIGEINDVNSNTIHTALSNLLLKCQELEKPYRPKLEKICFNYVNNLFEIPDDTIQLELSLVDEVDLSSSTIILDPTDIPDDMEFSDLLEIENIQGEVYKRRLLNVLSMGAGMQLSSNIESYIKEIYSINAKLGDLYNKIIALNNYLLFTKEDLNMTDENKMQIGTVEIFLGHEEDKVKIKAQGTIFPILLSETIRGFMELFSSHGLPKDMRLANNIIGKCDYLKAEPWDMRLGPSLWTLVTDSFESVDTPLIPYIYTKISKLTPKTFNRFMREIFSKTREGKRMMGKLIAKAKEEQVSSSNDDEMPNLNINKTLISDNDEHFRE